MWSRSNFILDQCIANMILLNQSQPIIKYLLHIPQQCMFFIGFVHLCHGVCSLRVVWHGLWYVNISQMYSFTSEQRKLLWSTLHAQMNDKCTVIIDRRTDRIRAERNGARSCDPIPIWHRKRSSMRSRSKKPCDLRSYDPICDRSQSDHRAHFLFNLELIQPFED